MIGGFSKPEYKAIIAAGTVKANEVIRERARKRWAGLSKAELYRVATKAGWSKGYERGYQDGLKHRLTARGMRLLKRRESAA
jgi:hypothetical protein